MLLHTEQIRMFSLGVANRVGQRQRAFGLGAENMKRQALRGFCADAGQMFQLIDQPLDGLGEIRHVNCSVME